MLKRDIQGKLALHYDDYRQVRSLRRSVRPFKKFVEELRCCKAYAA